MKWTDEKILICKVKMAAIIALLAVGVTGIISTMAFVDYRQSRLCVLVSLPAVLMLSGTLGCAVVNLVVLADSWRESDRVNGKPQGDRA